MTRFDPGKIIAPVAGLLLVFTALVSGGTYPWARSLFGFGAVMLFVLSMSGPMRRPGTIALLMLFPVVQFVSSLWTININNTIGQSCYVASLAFLSVAVAIGLGDERKKALLAVVFWTAVLVAVYGIYQYYIGFPRTEEFLLESGPQSGLSAAQIADAAATLRYRRIFSTMFSPNIMACYMAMTIPLGLDMYLDSRRGRLVYGASLALMVFSLALTKSAGGFISLAAASLVYIPVRFRGRMPDRRGIAGAVLVVVVLLVIGAAIYQKRSDNALGVGNSFSQRLDYLRSSIEVACRSPLLGSGAGSFEILYPAYMKPGADEVRYSHNLILQVLDETGVLGAFSLLLLLFMFIQKCVSRLKKGGDGGLLIPGILAGGVAFIVHNMADFSFYIPETAVLFFLYIGVACSNDGIAEMKGRPAMFAKSAAVIAALLVSFFLIKSYLSSSYKDEALAVLAESGVRNKAEASSAPPPPEAVELAEKAVTVTPYDDRAHAFLAGLYEGQAARDGAPLTAKAEGEYLAAIRLNPCYTFHYRDLGLLYMKLGDNVKAGYYFKAALSHYPTSPALAQYLKLAGNK